MGCGWSSLPCKRASVAPTRQENCSHCGGDGQQAKIHIRTKEEVRDAEKRRQSAIDRKMVAEKQLEENIYERKKSLAAQHRASVSQDPKSKDAPKVNNVKKNEVSDAARKEFLGQQRRMSHEIGTKILKGECTSLTKGVTADIPNCIPEVETPSAEQIAFFGKPQKNEHPMATDSEVVSANVRTFVQDILVNAQHIIETENNSVERFGTKALKISAERIRPSATHVMVEPLDLDVTNGSETDVEMSSTAEDTPLTSDVTEFVTSARSEPEESNNRSTTSKSPSPQKQSIETTEVVETKEISTTVTEVSADDADTNVHKSEGLEESVDQSISCNDEPSVAHSANIESCGSTQEVKAPSVASCVVNNDENDQTSNQAPATEIDTKCAMGLATTEEETVYYDVDEGKSKSDADPSVNPDDTNMFVESLIADEDSTFTGDDTSKLEATTSEAATSKLEATTSEAATSKLEATTSEAATSKLEATTSEAATSKMEATTSEAATSKLEATTSEAATSKMEATTSEAATSKLAATTSETDKTDATDSKIVENEPTQSGEASSNSCIVNDHSNSPVATAESEVNQATDEAVTSDIQANPSNASEITFEDLEANDTVPPMKLSTVTNRGMVSEMGTYDYKDDFESVCSTPFKSKHSIDAVPVASIVKDDSMKDEKSDLDLQAHELATKAITLAIDSVEDMTLD